MPMAATHPSATRRTIPSPDVWLRFRVGTRRTPWLVRPLEEFRSNPRPAKHTGTGCRCAPDCVQWGPNSYRPLQARSERLPKFAKCGPDSRLHSAYAVIQLLRRFLIGQFGEEGGFDDLPFV